MGIYIYISISLSVSLSLFLSLSLTGCVLIALWGVPTASYPCNATRALTCGVKMRQAAKDVGEDISIGVTTGSVYCGAVGSPLRQEYVAIGRTGTTKPPIFSSKYHFVSYLPYIF